MPPRSKKSRYTAVTLRYLLGQAAPVPSRITRKPSGGRPRSSTPAMHALPPSARQHLSRSCACGVDLEASARDDAAGADGQVHTTSVLHAGWPRACCHQAGTRVRCRCVQHTTGCTPAVGGVCRTVSGIQHGALWSGGGRSPGVPRRGRPHRQARVLRKRTRGRDGGTGEHRHGRGRTVGGLHGSCGARTEPLGDPHRVNRRVDLTGVHPSDPQRPEHDL